MKAPAKSLSAKTIQNLILGFKGIRYEKEILDNPRRVANYHYCMSNPKIRKNPHLAGLSKRVLSMLGYDQQEIIADQNAPHYLSGSKILPGSIPVAHNYCGHQFGVWAGQLGDGRAHTIGHVANNDKIYELQLKGSGKTPFSRHADGNSVVSSAVRQFLISQLMAGLGVPTTRALSLVIAQEDVVRDPFYNGIIKVENAAVIIRVAESFLRFGSFQVCNKDAQMHKEDPMENRKILSGLADYLLTYCYKHIDAEEGDPYEQMFKQIVVKTAELVAHWQSIGFVHGVLNTDNMSMVNVTIDYGPFGFIDYFSKDFISNQTDEYERYSYRQQPLIVKWNLNRLAQAMDILVPQSILKNHIDEHFDATYEKAYTQKMAHKLGLQPGQQSIQIVKQLLEVMHVCGSNFTNTFCKLSEDISQPDKIISSIMLESLPTDFYKRSLRIIANSDISEHQINKICYADPGFNRYFLSQQEQRRHILNLLVTESCEDRTKREKQLWSNWIDKYIKLNPNKEKQRKNTVRYVLVNQVAKNVTEELNTLKPQQQRVLLNKVLDVFSNPYEYNEWFEKKYWSKRPVPVRLTCSS